MGTFCSKCDFLFDCNTVPVAQTMNKILIRDVGNEYEAFLKASFGSWGQLQDRGGRPGRMPRLLRNSASKRSQNEPISLIHMPDVSRYIVDKF
jgi:hypothetical protein